MRKWEVTIEAALQSLAPGGSCTRAARMTENGRRILDIKGKPFKAEDLRDGRITLLAKWKPEKHGTTHKVTTAPERAGEKGHAGLFE